ncbi:GerAB/ArcD/ProY family transporter [Oceanobacillus sp. FSL W7-1309]|uniref:GerAB/ArcD/ProY family transporter n=1 Tax=Oceanobacillus sp. FSL W7-1309 TaxID=2954539 RepID=UPI0030FB7FF3
MLNFKYGDDKIQNRDIMIALPSMLIGVGILPFPRILAEDTRFSDGWIVILFSGAIVTAIAWCVAKLAANFPNQSFLDYSSSLVTKPVAVFFTFLFTVQGVALTAFEVRSIAEISHQYLFNRTPMEVVALTFLLVVVYAVANTRGGIFRLNAMFLPIIFITTGLLVLFSIPFMGWHNVLPMFKTDLQGYLQGSLKTTLSYTGVGILFFYISLVKEPKHVAKYTVIGMSWVIILYVFIFVTCIAVFGELTTANIRFPLIELAKSIEIPGGFFERIESIFFVIWIMAIFTTTAMAFDVGVLALSSILPKVKKIHLLFVLTPLIFAVAMIPRDFIEMENFGNYMSYSSWILIVIITTILGVMYKVKGEKQNEK